MGPANLSKSRYVRATDPAGCCNGSGYTNGWLGNRRRGIAKRGGGRRQQNDMTARFCLRCMVLDCAHVRQVQFLPRDVAYLSPMQYKVLQELTAHPGATNHQLGVALQRSAHTIKNILTDLRDQI